MSANLSLLIGRISFALLVADVFAFLNVLLLIFRVFAGIFPEFVFVFSN